ncbi:MAG TPA: hypothetical protein VFP93_04695, partial [Gammaproteobacteria bacterium]|nr:hypothetical protein [Gammaproteobacteria bacterium]
KIVELKNYEKQIEILTEVEKNTKKLSASLDFVEKRKQHILKLLPHVKHGEQIEKDLAALQVRIDEMNKNKPGSTELYFCKKGMSR